MSFIYRFFMPLFALGMFANAQAETVSFKLKGNPEFVSEAPLEKIVGVADGTLKIDVDFRRLLAPIFLSKGVRDIEPDDLFCSLVAILSHVGVK